MKTFTDLAMALQKRHAEIEALIADNLEDGIMADMDTHHNLRGHSDGIFEALQMVHDMAQDDLSNDKLSHGGDNER